MYGVAIPVVQMVVRTGGKAPRRRAGLISGRLSRGEGLCIYMCVFRWNSVFSSSFFQDCPRSLEVAALSYLMTDHRTHVLWCL